MFWLFVAGAVHAPGTQLVRQIAGNVGVGLHAPRRIAAIELSKGIDGRFLATFWIAASARRREIGRDLEGKYWRFRWEFKIYFEFLFIDPTLLNFTHSENSVQFFYDKKEYSKLLLKE